jgi:hypothetical protein
MILWLNNKWQHILTPNLGKGLRQVRNLREIKAVSKKIVN